MLLTVLLVLALLILIFFLPVKGARSYEYTPPSNRIDEADAVLSRRLLVPGTADYENYYSKHPENREADDRSREAPGLLKSGARYYHKTTFAASEANFEVIDHLGLLVETEPEANSPLQQGTPSEQNNPTDSDRNYNTFIKHWMKRTGAHSVGFTPLKDFHLYSHKGRGSRSGQRLELKHKNAIALTVEMDHDMMQAAPLGSSVMESSEQYLNSGVLALKLAAWIRQMGYEATAHIDGNYEVICPLVAVDAGLGVIGRMGLLMTPTVGPRVRISVVTTNMPLEASPAKPDRTTLQFCDLCKKCAINCPVGAIPDDSMKEVSGVKRWKICSEKCYHFWTTSGTDCGRCMSVCPYSHKDNAFHGFIRWSIKNNLLFRHLALKLDDVFYGKKPPVKSLPHWTDQES